MEVSTNSGINIEFTGEAKNVIIQLVRLDAVHSQEKAPLFEQLYQLWTTDGLISERIATRQFEEHSSFIYKAIVDTFKEPKKEKFKTIELIHNTLKSGLAYKTPDDKIIYCNKEAKDKYRNKFYNNNQNIKYHFNKLLGEFQQFIKDKNPVEPLPIEPVPIEDPPIVDLSINPVIIVTRESLDRNAKADAIVPGHFAGMTTDTTGSSKKKGGKMGNNTDLDDSKKVNKDLYFTSIYYFIIKLS